MFTFLHYLNLHLQKTGSFIPEYWGLSLPLNPSLSSLTPFRSPQFYCLQPTAPSGHHSSTAYNPQPLQVTTVPLPTTHSPFRSPQFHCLQPTAPSGHHSSTAYNPQPLQVTTVPLPTIHSPVCPLIRVTRVSVQVVSGQSCLSTHLCDPCVCLGGLWSTLSVHSSV